MTLKYIKAISLKGFSHVDYKMQKNCFLCGVGTAFLLVPHVMVTWEPALFVWICETSLLQQNNKEHIEQM
jgi:hypothetical protein